MTGCCVLARPLLAQHLVPGIVIHTPLLQGSDSPIRAIRHLVLVEDLLWRQSKHTTPPPGSGPCVLVLTHTVQIHSRPFL